MGGGIVLMFVASGVVVDHLGKLMPVTPSSQRLWADLLITMCLHCSNESRCTCVGC